ncbi:hypothetical protein [Quadrisphaera sp. KR29]|uniref:hypothetical protein n=1 Tax=Quadrisphaera sp. KR29 TaxID=3461391 RepID=UPI004044C94F
MTARPTARPADRSPQRPHERPLDPPDGADHRLVVASAALLLGGAALSDTHMALLGSGAFDPPQWVGLTTVMAYYTLLPAGLVLLWAPRRRQLGRTGAVAAAVALAVAGAHLLSAATAVVWGPLLGRGELPAALAPLQLVLYGIYLAPVLLGAAVVLNRRRLSLHWTSGALLALGIVTAVLVPVGGLSAVYGVLAVLLVTGAVRASRGPSAARATAAG